MTTDPSVEAQFRAAFDLSPTILCISGVADGRIRDVNRSFLKTSGYSREEAIGRTSLELGLWVDPAERERGLDKLRTGQQIQDLEARFRTKSGEERVALLAASILPIGGEPCVLTALTDITDRTRAEEALRESERRFMLAFHANPLPMSITRLDDQRHVEVNEAAVRHSGYTREEMLGRTKAELGLWVAPAQRERMLTLLREHGEVRDFEVTFRTRTGDQRLLLANSSVITFGGVPAVLSVSVDITERKQLEDETRSRRDEAEALAQSLGAANRAKDEFLAMLGHELRNPLGTITNAVGAMERLAPDDTTRHLVAIVNRQTAHLTRLVDDLLDVARLASGKFRLDAQVVDLHEVARRCVDAQAHAGRTQKHEVTLEGERVHVHGDPARLEQILNNLVDNALKYTPPGGRITVTTARAGADAVLSVRDTGKGIHHDLLPRVFDLFVQEPQTLDRSRGGLGLGLSLVRRLVELHGGAVSASSAGPGQGSEFTVRLPAVADAAGADAVAPVAREPRGRRRVLIIEDSADARDTLRLLLELAGHIVETSEDGPRGLAKLHTFRPEIALIDLGLPGIDGYTLARLARSQPETRDIRLVAVTGYGEPADQRRALAAGFDMHVTKPVDATVLQEVLDRSI
jgi:PAS domain S-box-containing protein